MHDIRNIETNIIGNFIVYVITYKNVITHDTKVRSQELDNVSVNNRTEVTMFLRNMCQNRSSKICFLDNQLYLMRLL